MSVKYSQWTLNSSTFSNQGPPKFSEIGIFGLKTNHLATLVSSSKKKENGAKIKIFVHHPLPPRRHTLLLADFVQNSYI
jgi:hypothetical protein